MTTRRMFGILLGVLLLGGVAAFVYFVGGAVEDERRVDRPVMMPERPEDATYELAGELVSFVDGRSQGSSRDVRFYTELAWGDLDGSGEHDAAVVLHEADTGTYHVVAALAHRSGFLGSNAVPFNVPHAPTLSIEDGIIVVRDVPPADNGTSTTTHPGTAQYFTLTAGDLDQVSIDEGESFVRGYLVYGHESRTFAPCASEDVYWLMPQSGSDAALRAIYEQRTVGLPPYTSVYIVLVGSVTQAPEEGFGADFNGGFLTTRILSAPRDGSCPAVSEESFATIPATTSTSTAVNE
jgi:hypothetical protein